MTLARCRDCNADIRWVETVNGRKMPLDAYPALRGNVILDGHGLAVVMGALDLSNLPADVDRYRSHFATCPKASERRKPKARLADFGSGG